MSENEIVSFESKLRNDCPALFRMNESVFDQSGTKRIVGRDDDPSPSSHSNIQSRLPMQNNGGLSRRMGERDAAKQVRQEIIDSLSVFGLEELNHIAKKIRFLAQQHQANIGSSKSAREQM